MSQRWVDEPPHTAEGWRVVWSEGREYRGKVAPGLFSFIGRIVRAVMHPQMSRQRDYNVTVADLLRDLRTDIDALRRDFETDRDALRADLRFVHTKFERVVERGDALVAALDQKIESIDARLGDIARPALTDTAPTFRDDWVYRRFEEAMRGSAAVTAATLAPIVQLARDNDPVLDLGCGRGELLRLCREAGIRARGVDSNERSVAQLRAEGFDVELASITDALQRTDAGSVGLVAASHVVEHLPFGPLLDLFHGAHRVLRSGGMLVIDTPNADSLAVAAGTIWNDPTHLAPRPESALIVLGRDAGFELERSETLNPFDASRRIETPEGADAAMTGLISRLNEILYGNQDLRVVLRKK